jgi:hypothetical protein
MTETRKITESNLIDSIRLVVPKFDIDQDWVDDILGYPIINDLARYICDRARLEDFEEVKSGLAFLEMGLEDGDSYLHGLVHESLETLQSCQHIESIKKYFGPRVHDFWIASFQHNNLI